MVSKTRANIFWILGTVLIFAGMRIATEADRTILGVTEPRFYSALLLSFGLILSGGMLWVSVGGALGKD